MFVREVLPATPGLTENLWYGPWMKRRSARSSTQQLMNLLNRANLRRPPSTHFTISANTEASTRIRPLSQTSAAYTTLYRGESLSSSADTFDLNLPEQAAGRYEPSMSDMASAPTVV